MAAIRSFTEILSWQRARQWSAEIFRHTKHRPFAGDQRLVVQINDSSESVMSNIAEGFGRGTQSEFIVFLGYALGSLDETRSHLCAAYDREYLVEAEFGRLFNEGTTIRKLIVAFIRSMILPRGGVRSQGRKVNWSNEVWEVYERVTGESRPEAWAATRSVVRQAINDEPPV